MTLYPLSGVKRTDLVFRKAPFCVPPIVILTRAGAWHEYRWRQGRMTQSIRIKIPKRLTKSWPWVIDIPMRWWFTFNAHSKICAILFLLITFTPLFAQQVADPNFKPQIDRPAYAEGKGPVVLIDEAHHNFHTADGRYKPFADILRRDGYRVIGSKAEFTRESLKDARILVIANALSEKNLNRPVLPTFSAFTPEEIAAVRTWVEDGGSLLLIADHLPWPGAAAELASAFGFLFADGFAFTKGGSGIIQFRTEDRSLQDHPIVRGRDSRESVIAVMTFAGQAFRVRRGIDAQPLLIFDDSALLLMPTEAWRFSKQTPRMSASGMFQGATLQHGSGRVAVFGEAAMFTAQLSKKKQPMGMNHPDAKYNAQFLLNVMHWLSGQL